MGKEKANVERTHARGAAWKYTFGKEQKKEVEENGEVMGLVVFVFMAAS